MDNHVKETVVCLRGILDTFTWNGNEENAKQFLSKEYRSIRGTKLYFKTYNSGQSSFVELGEQLMRTDVGIIPSIILKEMGLSLNPCQGAIFVKSMIQR